MSDIAIRVQHLSKQYHLGARKAAYTTFRETLINAARAPLRWLKGERSLGQENFWALDDVSFEIKHGESVGIIGRNGAGKSTLLKILSRITSPTRGRVDLYGRIGSLLEVGTGFHPELSGRENIFLNGAILGMRQAEIRRKFDEIVDFAEVERFLDTPVKHYSSGMYVRLAFAVAAHLEPEILLVDEVLAVGDAQFQKKCLGKMGDVANEGRTVLFVSHNMAAIKSLCQAAILLDEGKIRINDLSPKVIQIYFQNHQNVNSSCTLLNHKGRRLGYDHLFQQLRIFNDAIETAILPMGGNLRIEASFASEIPINNIRFGIAIEDMFGQRLLSFSPSLQAPNLVITRVTKGTFICDIPKLRLLPGLYFITLIIGNGTSDLDRIDQAGQFTVDAADVYGTGFVPQASHGIFYQDAKWKVTKC